MIAQAAIFILSGAGIWLLAFPQAGALGWVVGLAAQPFWLWETYRARQWGMFLNAVLWTGAFAAGLVNHWRAHG